MQIFITQIKDYNDSFYDITNAIMGKDVNSFATLEGKDTRITRTKTSKGTQGFSKKCERIFKFKFVRFDRALQA